MKLFNLFKLELTEKDFEDAPQSEEPDGVYQMLFIGKKIYFRNVDTGEITVHKNA